jgi:transposase
MKTECPNCQKLQAELNVLRGKLEEALSKIATLEDELHRGRRQATPFSRGKSKPNPKPPGRRRGEGRFSYRATPPEEKIKETIEVPLKACPDCGGELQECSTHEQIQVDLPKVEPIITRFRTESGYCPHCKKRVRSRHPQQVSSATGAAKVSIGPRAKGLGADLKHRLGIPYRKIEGMFEVAFGLKATSSGLCQSNGRLAKKAEPVYKELVEAIRSCASVHADETGWRIGVLSCWLWVFTSENITVYTIDERRSHEVVVEILGKEFKGVLVDDCFMAYDHKALSCWLQQKCFSHFLHQLSSLEKEKTRGAVRFPRAMAALLREALALRDQKSKLTDSTYRLRLRKLEARLDRLISKRRRFTDPDNARFAKRLRKQRRHLLTFMRLDGVEATNNRAERALRPAVIIRKTGGCNRSESGAKTHAVLASLLVTLKQQGRDGLGYLASVLTAPADPPKLLPVPLSDTS